MTNEPQVFLFGSTVAQDADYSGDGWLSGEAARRREREVHAAAHAGPPGNTSAIRFAVVMIKIRVTCKRLFPA